MGVVQRIARVYLQQKGPVTQYQTNNFFAECRLAIAVLP